MALVLLVAEEAFAAAAAVAAEADPDVRQRDLESAFPVIRVRCLLCPCWLGAKSACPHRIIHLRAGADKGLSVLGLLLALGRSACFWRSYVVSER